MSTTPNKTTQRLLDRHAKLRDQYSAAYADVETMGQTPGVAAADLALEVVAEHAQLGSARRTDRALEAVATEDRLFRSRSRWRSSS
ncbi:hypothetical protein [Candidatus Solirubrobacter pratensis]|uniref:hypothetical protein n=1 Tax=Candidatus Solirubrobacter pratensis TaxID=1298857 RepID=UPI00040AA355|nr:hypothetical protein [Candidatus Solirubrobacter pratensis]